MPSFRGLPACTCLAAWLPVFETAIGRSPRWFQLVGDAPSSAGFHRGGGSADSEPLSDDELRIARNMGAAAWNRWWENNYHAHLRLNGCPHNTIAQPQVADLNAGRDGTGPLYDNAGVPDNGPRDGVLWPLRTWREGITWAEDQEDEMKPEDWDRLRQMVDSAADAAADRAVQKLLKTELGNGVTVQQNLRRAGDTKAIAVEVARELGTASSKGTRSGR